ncbi:hypothetical protein [Aerococcus kribbianus]|uniref:Uncharacterized protein n=1 Tax=Aerococcus kribbianus TaxID=2999064 RepID=A0A9X3FW56_9LACT|nr:MULTISPECIES: hypothetical protein [unclassified Aerococcus]MCZ0717329.1 hypothetical protein [Aerococcus sp. YH-aer221]MCZ0725617.1 hypothetical protein [Aerococcus sp. YH-aer222]
MVKIIQENYEYILIIVGLITEGYAIFTSEEDEKKTGLMIVASILVTVGCIISAVTALD